ncbi:hypothetical protein FACS1894217_03490 [Clostridia bacterium]|nr:hypothetical protein FACS1894217_03490 [Clostridia bacterium]
MYIYAAFPIKERFADLDAMGYKRIAITYEGIVQEDRPIFEEIARMNLPDSILSEIMRQHLDYLQTKEESQLLYDAGYKQLTFGDIRMELWLFLIAVILLIAILGGFAAMEYRSGAIVLMRSSAKGYKKVIRAKLFIAIIAAFFVCLLVYIPQIYGVLYSYGMPVPSAPAYSMEHLWFLPQTMTIFRAITASMCLRLIILIAFAVLLLELSKLAKNVIQAYLLCSGVLILPILLALVLT